MNFKFFFLLICFVSVKFCFAASCHDRPVAEALRVSNKIEVDGQLNEDCWKSADVISGFYSVKSNELVDVQPTAHLVFDESALYIGVKIPAEDVELKAIKKLRPGQMFGNDTIEIFLDPFEKSRKVFQFAVNAANGTFDSADWVEGWEPDWQSATFIGDKFWSLEVRIPFSILSSGFKYKKDWGLNITRGASCWAPTKGFFNQPPLFGKVRKIFPPQEYCLGIDFPGIVTSIKNKEAKINFSNASSKDITVNLRTQIIFNEGQEALLVQDNFVCKPGVNEYSLKLDKWKQGAQIFVKVFDDKTKKLIAENNGIVNHEGQYGSTWNRSFYMNEKKAILKLCTDLKDFAKSTYKIVVLNKEGEVVKEKAFLFNPDGKASIEFKLSDFPLGTYAVKVNRSNGNIIHSSLLDSQLRKLPYKGGAVQFCDKGQILRDGKPFFPLGLYYAFRYLQKSPEFLEEYSKAGFNTQMLEWQNADQTIIDINNQKQHGVFPIIGLYSVPELHNQPGMFNFPSYWKTASDLTGKIAKAAGDGILFWNTLDEPWIGEGHKNTKKLHNVVNSMDPYHPTITINFKPMEFFHWKDTTDVFGTDPYPGFPHGVMRRVPILLEAATGVFKNRPVIAILQTYIEKGGEMPSPQQLRFMTYLSLIKRANGILYFSYDYLVGPMKQKSPESWNELKKLAGEVQKLTSVLTLGLDSNIKINVSQEEGLYTRVIEYNDDLYVMVANILNEPLGEIEFKIDSNQRSLGSSVEVLFENRKRKLERNSWKDRFDAFGVHLYKLNFNQMK